MSTKILIAAFVGSSLISAIFAEMEKHSCAQLRNNATQYNVEGMIQTWNKEYLRYTEVPNTCPACKESLMRKLDDCEFQFNTELIKIPYKDKPNKTLTVGQLDIRTQGEKVNFAIKIKQIHPCCMMLPALLKIMQQDSFNDLYDPSEKIILLLLTYGLYRESVIHEWIAIFYQYGDIVDTQYHTKCLEKEDVREQNLMFKGKPLLEYFKGIKQEPQESE